MPELPEVETVVCGLKQQIVGQKIIALKVNYQPIVKTNLTQFKKALINSQITDILRHGKYIFIELNGGQLVVVHLRMTGQLFVAKTTADKHTHLEILLENCTIVYRDIRKFGRFELIAKKDFTKYITAKKLAADALEIEPAQFYQNIKNKQKALKAVLLDQAVIAGLGNIYVDEVLIREKLSPLLKASELSSEQAKSLLSTIKKVLKKAILNKGTTFSDYVTSYGDKGKFQLSLLAYNCAGKPCPHCQTAIQKTRVAGRGTYYCPNCQKDNPC